MAIYSIIARTRHYPINCQTCLSLSFEVYDNLQKRPTNICIFIPAGGVFILGAGGTCKIINWHDKECKSEIPGGTHLFLPPRKYSGNKTGVTAKTANMQKGIENFTGDLEKLIKHNKIGIVATPTMSTLLERVQVSWWNGGEGGGGLK